MHWVEKEALRRARQSGNSSADEKLRREKPFSHSFHPLWFVLLGALGAIATAFFMWVLALPLLAIIVICVVIYVIRRFDPLHWRNNKTHHTVDD